MLDRSPQTRYDENVDMTLINRRDGQRLILYTNYKNMYLYPDTVLNVLRTYHKRQFVDYVICSSYQHVFRSVAHHLGIPVLDYEADGESGSTDRLFGQIFTAYPTAAAFFRYGISDDELLFNQYCKQYHLPLEVINV